MVRTSHRTEAAVSGRIGWLPMAVAACIAALIIGTAPAVRASSVCGLSIINTDRGPSQSAIDAAISKCSAGDILSVHELSFNQNPPASNLAPKYCDYSKRILTSAHGSSTGGVESVLSCVIVGARPENNTVVK